MLECNQKITQTSGLEWLLKNDPSMRRSGAAIRNVGALARRLVQFQDRACGATSFDDEELALAETIAANEHKEIEAWRKLKMSEELENFLDLVREEGTAGVAKRMGCTQRAVQMKIKKLSEEGVGSDLFFGEAA